MSGSDNYFYMHKCIVIALGNEERARKAIAHLCAKPCFIEESHCESDDASAFQPPDVVAVVEFCDHLCKGIQSHDPETVFVVFTSVILNVGI